MAVRREVRSGRESSGPHKGIQSSAAITSTHCLGVQASHVVGSSRAVWAIHPVMGQIFNSKRRVKACDLVTI